jgi:Uma2 family endonuclease
MWLELDIVRKPLFKVTLSLAASIHIVMGEMTSLLENPAVRQQVHRMSIEEYHRAGEAGVISEKVELLRGIVVNKMAKSPLHEFVLQMLLKLLLRCVPSNFEVRLGSPLTLRDSEPEPDISVVQGEASDWLKEHPRTAHLVIEIAISSAAIDNQKAEIYAEAGIAEYWIVRPEQRAMDVYRQPTSDGYLSKTTVKDSDSVLSQSLPQIKFCLRDVLPK